MGRRLVPQLVAGGYEVIAMTRDQGKASWLRRVGAQPVIADALDRAAVVAAVKRSEPEVVIHQLTGLTGVKSFRNFDKEFALTNRLRTEGTDYLLEAARAAGVRRIVAQSYGNWNYERTGSSVKTEQDPFDPHPPANQVRSLQAIRYVEDAVVNADGTLSSCWETAGKPDWKVGTVAEGYLADADIRGRWTSCESSYRYADDAGTMAGFEDTVDAALLDYLSETGRLPARQLRHAK